VIAPSNLLVFADCRRQWISEQ